MGGESLRWCQGVEGSYWGAWLGGKCREGFRLVVGGGGYIILVVAGLG